MVTIKAGERLSKEFEVYYKGFKLNCVTSLEIDEHELIYQFGEYFL